MCQRPRRAGPLLAALALLAQLAPAAPAGAEPIEILVLKEHGVGSPSLAQPFVDRFVALAARHNGWASASGHYVGSRSAGEAFLRERSPEYAILSLPAFLALRGPLKLVVVGRVASSLAGGEQYFVVSRSARDLAGCKGGRFASDHFSDARFVEKVVARGAFRLSEFEIVENRRPLQSLRQVLGGEVACALLDDAQLAELEHLATETPVHVAWKSPRLPPMAVVALPHVGAEQRKAFQATLRDICTGDGKTACAEVGIHALEPADAEDYAEVSAAYAR